MELLLRFLKKLNATRVSTTPSLSRLANLFVRAVCAADRYIETLNAELNPICHLQALLGAHHILHVFRIRVKFRLFSKYQSI